MVTRKEFLKRTFELVSGAVAQSVEKRLPDEIAHAGLFPPGAVGDFRLTCTSCGDCVGACPETAIRLEADALTDKELPVITPSEKACVMCEEVPCIQVCNDGALVLPPSGGFPAIGSAFVRTEFCLAFNGSVCMICYDACPLKRSALRFVGNRPVVYEDLCTGCGQCEYICPVDEKGIAILS